LANTIAMVIASSANKTERKDWNRLVSWGDWTLLTVERK